MSRGTQRSAAALASVFAVGGLLLAEPAFAHEGHDGGDHPDAWVLVDADTGIVLDAHNEHEALPPASVVKLMTALTALEQAPLDSTVTVSAEAASKPARRIDMQEGEVWPLDDALAAMLIVSANDAAYAIAESIGGDVASFADDMNDTARLYGLRDSELRDPAGFDDEVNAVGGGSRMSAFDLAIVGRNFLSVPELAQYPPEENYEFTGPDGDGHRLLPQNLLLDLYEGTTGLKTGSTDLAGNTLVASATRDGQSMIAVVLGFEDTYGFATALLDSGFAGASDLSGTGETVPAPRALTADARQLVVDLAPSGFAPYAEAAFAAPRAAEEDAGASETVPQAAESPAGDEAADPGDSGVAWSSWLRIVLIVAVVVVVLFAARRAHVVRDRRQRLRRRQALAEAKRRGTIHVVDKEPKAATSSLERVRKHPSLGERARGELSGRERVGSRPPGQPD